MMFLLHYCLFFFFSVLSVFFPAPPETLTQTGFPQICKQMMMMMIMIMTIMMITIIIIIKVKWVGCLENVLRG